MSCPTARPPRLPIFLNLEGKRILLVGGGFVALEKAEKLLEAGASLTVVAKAFRPEFLERVRADGVRVDLREGEVHPRDVLECFLVVSATNDSPLNARIAGWARAAGVPVNSVDDAGNCDFFFSASLWKPPLQIAVSSDGSFPGLSRALRQVLEEILPQDVLDELGFLAQARALIKEKLASAADRARILKEISREVRCAFLPEQSH